MAQEAEVDFTLADIDRLSRQIPHLCKVSPASRDYYMEDVHRAGGIMGILGELERAGLIDTSVKSLAGDNLGEVLAKWDYIRSQDPDVSHFYRSAPGGQRTIEPYSQGMRWREMDLDRQNGCIRDFDRPYSTEGNLALVEDGDVIKIDIPNRSINVMISDDELASRRDAMNALPSDEAWQPKGERTRVITRALKAYAAFATSADRGGFRDL